MSRKSAPRLLLCSLGIRPPQSVTLEVFEALRRCDVVFAGPCSSQTARFLRHFCKDIRLLGQAIVRHSISRVFAQLRPGRLVGYAAFGHPMILGTLADTLHRRALRQGVSCGVLAGLSCFDAFLVAARHTWSYSYPWIQILEDTRLKAGAAGAQADGSLPLVAYLEEGTKRDSLRKLRDYCLKSYSPDHECLLFKLGDGSRTPFARTVLKDLALSRPLINSCLLFLKPSHGN